MCNFHLIAVSTFVLRYACENACVRARKDVRSHKIFIIHQNEHKIRWSFSMMQCYCIQSTCLQLRRKILHNVPKTGDR